MVLASGPSSIPHPDCHTLSLFPQNTLDSHAPPSSAGAHGPSHALNQRRSLSLMRKPLRSSPLSGPVLSSDGTHEEEKLKIRRLLSTPNLHSRACSEPHPPLPLLPLPTPTRVSKCLTRHMSLLELFKRPLGKKAHPSLPAPPSSVAPASSFDRSIIHAPLPPLPLFRPPPSKCPRVCACSQSSPTASISMTDPPFALPNFPRAHTAPPSCRRAPTLPLSLETNAGVPSCDSAARRCRNDSEDSWLTATPYGTTPRFSRMGLAAPSIVLPVPARAPRRNTLRGEGAASFSQVPYSVARQVFSGTTAAARSPQRDPRRRAQCPSWVRRASSLLRETIARMMRWTLPSFPRATATSTT
ncbi:hypothetical protein B0H12DRAFT_663252 [Mycena haematopus]|nr:hypothetical protein B0H12DRAFT_663252 [Mycena haematopus]